VEFSEETNASIKTSIEKAIQSADSVWLVDKKAIIDGITSKKTTAEAELSIQNGICDSLKDKVQVNQAITQLTERLRAESEKLDEFVELEKQHKQIDEKKQSILKSIVASIGFFKEQHTRFAATVEKDAQAISDDLEFSVEVPFRSEAFVTMMNSMIDSRTLKKVISDEYFEADYTADKLKEIIEKTLNGELRACPFCRGICVT